MSLLPVDLGKLINRPAKRTMRDGPVRFRPTSITYLQSRVI
jgi:hypothetical protein